MFAICSDHLPEADDRLLLYISKGDFHASVSDRPLLQ